MSLDKNLFKQQSHGLDLGQADKLTLSHIKFAQGMGPCIRYANELRAVQQVGRSPLLKSSRLHEDVLKGNLGPGTGMTYEQEDIEQRSSACSRLIL